MAQGNIIRLFKITDKINCVKLLINTKIFYDYCTKTVIKLRFCASFEEFYFQKLAFKKMPIKMLWFVIPGDISEFMILLCILM